MTRIIAGEAGSIALDTPRGPTRPTSDRVREAMFSAIDNLIDLNGARVLDLYAGSGALGLEAVSRGAESAVFVDTSAPAITSVKANAARVARALSRNFRWDAVRQSVSQYCSGLTPGKVFDLVLVDPPYEVGTEDIESLLEDLSSHLDSNGLVVVERSTKSALPHLSASLEFVKKKTYGDTAVYFVSPKR